MGLNSLEGSCVPISSTWSILARPEGFPSPVPFIHLCPHCSLGIMLRLYCAKPSC
ncbi:hypothetical protein BDV38DRAFT_236733 [Aspergillus pseudotamarii]|uniref:Uncharacterized protein n=1 Tax=Aspergillus pseudotamarii TaxID=132259 RepID=A0A5N6T6P1_ASPPS|nr:uncharacterized protein BDV38DRAFT_236733 [Aspergillus pseudotamarii]KAE8141972.1 hypothetical protein BDV38DRAFT_236733 [Aspergillus pseudotamarii]